MQSTVSDYGTLKNFPSMYMPNGTDIIPIIIAVMRLASIAALLFDKIEDKKMSLFFLSVLSSV